MRRLAVIAALLLMAGGCVRRAVSVPAPIDRPSSPAPQDFSKQVLAFYYGWYGRPGPDHPWVHWSNVDETARLIGSATHYPALGAYDSQDRSVVAQHCRWAKEAGITGFVVSWWRPGDLHDRGLPLLLDEAAATGLKIAVYIEQIRPVDAPTPEGAIDDVLYVLNKYAQHPAWLKVRGRAVLFVYARAMGQLSLGQWGAVIAEANGRYSAGALFIADRLTTEAARVFDGIHVYNPTGRTARQSVDEIRTWARSAFPQWIETAGPDRISCVTVIPGYDDTTQGRPPPRPITDRYDGETYRALWEEALAANPDWILICSWNEWHEGSEIEPSDENGDRELKATAALSGRFLATPLRVRTSRPTRSPG